MRTHPDNHRLDDLFFVLTIAGFAISLIAGSAMELSERVETIAISQQYRTPTPTTHEDKTRVDIVGTSVLSNATTTMEPSEHAALSCADQNTTEARRFDDDFRESEA